VCVCLSVSYAAKCQFTSCHVAENWKPALLEVIDADQLPVHWGGMATDADGDPYCRSQVDTLHLCRVLLCFVAVLTWLTTITLLSDSKFAVQIYFLQCFDTVGSVI